ncbi:MAG: hypothetical protein U5K54_27545 [Cytophagales bacterium]|nr:hypothetical protein [Cytophagales bacterium]
MSHWFDFDLFCYGYKRMPKGNETQRCAGTGRTFKVDGGIRLGGGKNVWTEYNDRFGFEILFPLKKS